MCFSYRMLVMDVNKVKDSCCIESSCSQSTL